MLMADKVSKASVNYRLATSSERCDNCSMYRTDPKRCTLVAGKIRPQDTCDEWEPK